MSAPTVVVADSVTQLGGDARGAVVVCGSHGGLYPAHVAAGVEVRAVVFNDAAVGRDGAGIAGLAYLERLGIAAVAVGHDSARIGDGADIMARGVVRYVNRPARDLGCRPGLPCDRAVDALRLADHRAVPLPVERESRFRIAVGPPVVWALDSASLVRADDRDAIVLTGSHGGLLGGHETAALKHDALAALFNDAGVGRDGAGVGRLAALDRRGIAAATVHADSARIGDGRSTYEDGIVSAVNDAAARLGGRPGMAARTLVDYLAARLREKGSVR